MQISVFVGQFSLPEKLLSFQVKPRASIFAHSFAKEKLLRSQQLENVYAYFVWKLGLAAYIQGLLFCHRPDFTKDMGLSPAAQVVVCKALHPHDFWSLLSANVAPSRFLRVSEWNNTPFSKNRHRHQFANKVGLWHWKHISWHAYSMYRLTTR